LSSEKFLSEINPYNDKCFTFLDRKNNNKNPEHIVKDVFPWLPQDAPIEQVAVLITASRPELAGARVESVDGFMNHIKQDVLATGKMSKAAIPEEYDLLRTLQLVLCGYYKTPAPDLELKNA